MILVEAGGASRKGKHMTEARIYSLLAVVADAVYEDLLIYTDAEIAVYDSVVDRLTADPGSALTTAEATTVTALAARSEAALAAAPAETAFTF